MEIIEISKEEIKLKLSKDELGMFYSGLQNSLYGFVFDFSTVLLSRQEALVLFEKIKSKYKAFSGNEVVSLFLVGEFVSLIKLHKKTMKELDPIEYPIITGYSFKEAEIFLSELEDAAGKFDGS